MTTTRTAATCPGCGTSTSIRCATEGVDQLTGSRAYDMALRLQYDDVAVGAVNTDIAPALAAFIAAAKGKPKRIFCTYTAMLAIRRELSKITTVEVVS